MLLGHFFLATNIDLGEIMAFKLLADGKNDMLLSCASHVHLCCGGLSYLMLFVLHSFPGKRLEKHQNDARTAGIR